MKQIRNLSEKNDYFGELKYKFLTEEIHIKAFPVLMAMVSKRNGDIKTRCCSHGGFQKTCANREDFASPTPNFMCSNVRAH